jgi:hypothetical protein
MALIAGSVITALGAIITATDIHPDHWARPLGFLWIYAFIALTINALVSVIIFHSAIRASHPNLGLVGTIIESCITTAVTVLAIVVFYRAEYELLLIFVPVCGMVQVRSPVHIFSINADEVFRQRTAPSSCLASSRVRRSAPRCLKTPSICLARRTPRDLVVVTMVGCEKSLHQSGTRVQSSSFSQYTRFMTQSIFVIYTSRNMFSSATNLCTLLTTPNSK